MTAVSVITPCYNSSAYIGATIASVRAQTLGDWEHIVVDDGSTDDPGAVVQPLAMAEPRLKFVRKENGGVASARNCGLRHSDPASKYLFFLDADDVAEPDMLATAVAYMEHRADVGMVHFAHRYIDGRGEPIQSSDWHIGNLHRYVPGNGVWGVRALAPSEAETPFVSIFCGAGIIPSICVMRRSAYELTVGWDEEFGQPYEDSDVFLQIALRSRVHFVPERLLFHRRHFGQNTSDLGRIARQESKLYAKWHTIQGVTKAERAQICAAERFREDNLVPFSGWRSGHAYVRAGRLPTAARFYLGAVRRSLLGAARGMAKPSAGSAAQGDSRA